MSLNRKVTVPLGRAGMRGVLPFCVAFLTHHSDEQLGVICKQVTARHPYQQCFSTACKQRPGTGWPHHTTAQHPLHEQQREHWGIFSQAVEGKD